MSSRNQDGLDEFIFPRPVLPVRPFLYTLDQIADLLRMPETHLRQYVFYLERSTGIPAPHALQARNIAPPGITPEWRIEEREFIRWMRTKGIQPLNRY